MSFLRLYQVRIGYAWQAYQWGEKDALDRLIQYNTADIVNQRLMMEIGYREMKTRSLFLHIHANS